jgi:hypothetical protein
MNDVTVRAEVGEELTVLMSKFDAGENDPWCTVYIISSSGCTNLRFESHASSLHLLDALRGQLERASKYLRS